MIIQERPYQVNWSGNGIFYKLYSATSLLDKTVVVEVALLFKRKDANQYTQLLTQALIPDNKGIVTVNWQPVLHSELKFFMPDIDNPFNLVQFAFTQTGSFYMQFREISNAYLDAPWTDDINNICHVVKGGVPEFYFNNNAFWSAYFPQVKPFLSWQTNRWLKADNEIMYLAWLHPFSLTAITSFKVLIKVYYTDFTEATKILTFFSSPGMVLYIPSGLAMLGLETLIPAKKIWYWTFQVFDNTVPGAPTAISSIFSYELDNRTDYNQVHLLYRGSTGGLDSVRVRGVIEEQPDYDVQEATSTMSPYFDSEGIEPTKVSLPATELTAFKGEVGYLKKEEQDRLRDLLHYREVYQVMNKKAYPLNLTTKKFIRSTVDKRWSLPIDWTMANEGNKFYAPAALNKYEGTEHGCKCIIRQNSFSRAFESDDEICRLTWALIVQCEDNSHEYRMQYKINGVTDWIEIAYTDATYPETVHPAGLANVDIFWRVVCPDGGVGESILATFNTIKDPATAANSRITNNTDLNIYGLLMKCNDVGIAVEMPPVGGFSTFFVPDGLSNIQLRSLWHGWGNITLISDGITYIPVMTITPPLTSRTYTFTGVKIVNGIQINID